MGTTPGRLDGHDRSPCQLLEFFLLLMSFVLASFSDDAPLPWSDLPLRNPWILTPFLLTALQPEISQATFFLTNFFLLHSLPYSFHFANLCTSYSCHFSNLSTSLLFSFTASLLSLISHSQNFPALSLPCFLHSPLPYFPILSFSYSFSFPGIFWIKCCVWLGE